MKENIGLLIKQIRTKNNISRTELAKKAGCTRKAIEYWEKGQRTMSVENADKVFEALKEKLVIGKRKEKDE